MYTTNYYKTWTQPFNGRYLEYSGDTEEQTRQWLFALKDGLTTSSVGKWSVLASSGKNGGGSLQATTDDNWFVATDLVRGATSGSDRSWIVFKSPRSFYGHYYLLMDWWGTNDYQAHFYLSRYAPDVSSPVINARPPAGGAEWSYADFTVHNSTGAEYYNHRGYLFQGGDGSFVFACATKGGLFKSGFIFNVMSRHNLRSDEVTGAVSLQWSDRTTKMVHTDTIRFRGLHSDESQINLAPVGLGADGINIVGTVFSDMAYNGFMGIPVWLFTTDGGKLAFRGVLEDIIWSPSVMKESVPGFSGEIIKATKVGMFWIPAFERVLLP